jgi:RNA polymerase-binding transcription factor DksA
MMNSHQIETYRERLRALAQRHSDGMDRLHNEALHGLGGESGGGLSNAPMHLADLGTAHHEGEVGLALFATEERLLAESNAALDRIDAGTFGLCERCFQEIPTARLDAFPYARFCIACSRMSEKSGEDPGLP